MDGTAYSISAEGDSNPSEHELQKTYKPLYIVICEAFTHLGSSLEL